ncbi:hypothetical protein BH09ACT6_BH09ACT6_16110 [soil metagenome]
MQTGAAETDFRPVVIAAATQSITLSALEWFATVEIVRVGACPRMFGDDGAG